ncbi:hypothetical protein C7974DRAFT_452671 [Boeremia exigua]|uniref:uncharacterized protein n=1 Tax=Boeremia exigua TaxID=749465 RepID=UPI001E8D07E5|nr:uncharacterized protein C7974DRAFT_452671 [Boeremia exigua]KAH6633408.1 hypothetical protein C7974DRAFT_452671 [Boeremia exigua]
MPSLYIWSSASGSAETLPSYDGDVVLPTYERYPASQRWLGTSRLRSVLWRQQERDLELGNIEREDDTISTPANIYEPSYLPPRYDWIYPRHPVPAPPPSPAPRVPPTPAAPAPIVFADELGNFRPVRRERTNEEGITDMPPLRRFSGRRQSRLSRRPRFSRENRKGIAAIVIVILSVVVMIFYEVFYKRDIQQPAQGEWFKKW